MRKEKKRARWIFGGITIAIVIAVCLWITLFHRALIRTAEAYAAEKFSFPVYQTRIYDSIAEGPADYYVVFTTDDQPYPVQFEVGLRNGEVSIDDYYSNVSNRVLMRDLYVDPLLAGRFSFLVIVENYVIRDENREPDPETVKPFPEGDVRELTAAEVLDWNRWEQWVHISIEETLSEETARALIQELWDDLAQKHYRCVHLWITCETEGYDERQLYSLSVFDSEVSRKDNNGWYDGSFREEAEYLAQFSGDGAGAPS